METLLSTIRFTREDFPAFGGPISATERAFVFSGVDAASGSFGRARRTNCGAGESVGRRRDVFFLLSSLIAPIRNRSSISFVVCSVRLLSLSMNLYLLMMSFRGELG